MEARVSAAAHRAPPVTYPVCRSAAMARLLLGLWALGLAPLFFMLFQAPALAGIAPAAIFFVVCCLGLMGATAVALWRFWSGQGPRQLRWDGADWFLLEPARSNLVEAPSPGHVRVRLDLQRCCLLQWRGQDGRPSQWLWADATFNPQRWHLLRCALYSKAPGPIQAEADFTQRA